MAISITYGAMQRQIADELGDRQDLLNPLGDASLSKSPIQFAIQSAIAKWERTPFYFTEVYDPTFFTMTAGTERYTSTTINKIATAANFFGIHIVTTLGVTRYPLIRSTWKQIDDLSTSGTAQARPTHWAYFAETLRFYPLPDDNYVVAAAYTERGNELTLGVSSNVWTQDGADLIRAEAKLFLALEVLHDNDLAQRMRFAIYGDPADPRAKGYLQVLLDETARRGRFDVEATPRVVDDPAGKIAVRKS